MIYTAEVVIHSNLRVNVVNFSHLSEGCVWELQRKALGRHEREENNLDYFNLFLFQSLKIKMAKEIKLSFWCRN